VKFLRLSRLHRPWRAADQVAASSWQAWWCRGRLHWHLEWHLAAVGLAAKGLHSVVARFVTVSEPQAGVLTLRELESSRTASSSLAHCDWITWPKLLVWESQAVVARLALLDPKESEELSEGCRPTVSELTPFDRASALAVEVSGVDNSVDSIESEHLVLLVSILFNFFRHAWNCSFRALLTVPWLDRGVAGVDNSVDSIESEPSMLLELSLVHVCSVLWTVLRLDRDVDRDRSGPLIPL